MTKCNLKHVYVIAEAGVNHNGQKDLAFALVDAAAKAGVDAVKFQTFSARRLVAAGAPKAAYQKDRTDRGESQRAMLEKLELPLEWHGELQKYARNQGIEFLSTAFDEESLRFLNGLDIPILKVPSGELTNAPLIWQFAKTGKPLILSTGMAFLSEVEEALAVISHALISNDEPVTIDDVWRCWAVAENRQKLCQHVTLLHCTSQYPTPPEEVDLLAMDTLASAFGLDVGYSDHTEGTLVSFAAVARGAKIIEKHFTVDRTLPGPDHVASLEPSELKGMVDGIRALESVLGSTVKAPHSGEWDTRRAARQQVVAVRDIKKGAILVRDDLTTARCGEGLPPAALWSLVGKKADRDHAAGESI